jgi:hypothetical protein
LTSNDEITGDEVSAKVAKANWFGCSSGGGGGGDDDGSSIDNTMFDVRASIVNIIKVISSNSFLIC